jgi:cell fate regulator YaaT (PSP1 superfamily)
MINTVSVRLHGRGKACLFNAEDYDVHRGDGVLVRTEQGLEYGVVTGEPIAMELEGEDEIPTLLRIATAEDTVQFEENKQLEKEAFKICFERIAWFGLEMRLVDAEYLFDKRKIIFYFTADGRIDFRELVKDLAGTFRTRIELRQIGVRDEARLIGGIGQCGRELCCGSFLRDFVPVTIRMAKEQNLSMNPQKISGICGRLLCCLNYEQYAYEDANRRVPARQSVVLTPKGEGIVESANVLKETVSVRMSEGDEGIEVFRINDIEVIVSANRKGRQKRRGKSGGEKN